MSELYPLRKGPLTIFLVWALGSLFWWGLAFYPTPATNPEWLSVARQVCFGTMENGLPSPTGWMVLILGPLSFLVAFLITWPSEFKHWVGAIWNMRLACGKIMMALLFAVFFVEAYWVANKVRDGLAISNYDFRNSTTEELSDTYPRTRNPVTDFELVDQFGKTVTLENYRGKTVVLTFAFAHCQTVCPTLVADCLESLVDFDPKKVELLIVTLDPWRDTPKALPHLAEEWGLPAHAHVLSGSVKAVTAVLDSYKIPYERDESTGDVTHPALVYIIDPEGMIAYTFNNAPASWLRKAIENIQNAKGSVGSHSQARSSIQSSL